MKPGYGDVLLAEGDPDVAEDERALIEAFRRQLELGMWAAVPTGEPGGNGNGGSNGNGNGAGNGNGHGPRGHGNAGAPWATPDPAAPAR